MKTLLMALLLGSAMLSWGETTCENTAANSPFKIQAASAPDGKGADITIIASPLSCELQAVKFTVTWTQTFNTKPYVPAGCTWDVSGTVLTCTLIAEIENVAGGSTLKFTTFDTVSNVQVTAAGILTLTAVWAEQ